MLVTTIIILLLITFISFLKYHDVASPAFLHNILWITALIGLFFMKESSLMTFGTYAIIIIGSIVFQLGFASKTIRLSKKRSQTEFLQLSMKNSKILFYIVLIPFLFVLYQYTRYISVSDSSSWYSLLIGAYNNVEQSTLFSYISKFIQISFLSIIYVYWKNINGTKRKIKLYIILFGVMAFLSVIALPTRNGMLFFVLPLLFIYIITHNVSIRRILMLLLISFLIFMLFFFTVSLEKYAYLYTAGKTLQIIMDEILVYLSGGILALNQTFQAHAFTGLGQYSLRFFIAIYDELFNTNNAVSIVNSFTTIGSYRTNVYTFYDFYIRDFGVFYALALQFVYGYLHGYLYKGMKQGKAVSSILLSILMYPLLMQFFQDQYLSLLSLWLQVILSVVVVTRFVSYSASKQTQIDQTNYR